MPNVVTEEQRTEAHKYEMPDVEVGTPVMYHAFHDTLHPSLAFVVKKSLTGRNVMLRHTSGQIYEGVRHVDDPKLTWNNDHRESGSWDFTPEWKRLEKERNDVKSRIDAIEHSLTKKPRSASPKK